MTDGIIGMEDMDAIFTVTDSFGIHRESVSVELSKEDPGSIQQEDQSLGITIPATIPIEVFAETLRLELESLGFLPAEPEES